MYIYVCIVPYKIFSSFIRNRLQAFLDNNNYHNNNIQKGFCPRPRWGSGAYGVTGLNDERCKKISPGVLRSPVGLAKCLR